VSAPDGLVTTPSANDFATTLGRLIAAIAARQMTLFAVIDHADGAHIAGLDLDPTTLVVFGNAKGGTPLMQQNRRIGLDLPLKVLVWQDSGGVRLTASDPGWIAARHGLQPGAADGLKAVLEALTAEAAR